MKPEQLIAFAVASALAVGFGIIAHRQARALGLPAAAVSVVGGVVVAIAAPRLR